MLPIVRWPVSKNHSLIATAAEQTIIDRRYFDFDATNFVSTFWQRMTFGLIELAPTSSCNWAAPAAMELALFFIPKASCTVKR